MVGSGLCILAQRLKHHHGSRPRISRLTVTEYLLYAVLLMLDDEPGKADTVREPRALSSLDGRAPRCSILSPCGASPWRTLREKLSTMLSLGKAFQRHLDDVAILVPEEKS